MNSTGEDNGFQCPNGFIEEDVASQLYLEDLDDDSELWLVRIPSHVNPSALEKQEIDLNKRLNTLSTDNINYECISEKCEMPNLSLILPQKENKRLTRVKHTFKGSVFLYEMEEAQPQIKVEENNTESEDIFNKPKSKKHKEKHMESDLSSAIESVNEDSECLSPKKKSHKKKKSSVKLEPSSE